MKLSVAPLYLPLQPFLVWPWYRFERSDWHNDTRATGLIVHWLWWQFHLVWHVTRGYRIRR